METVLVQINHTKAYKILEDLEELDVIKVLQKTSSSNPKRSEKYAGKLAADVAEQMQQYVTQSRNEWDSRI